MVSLKSMILILLALSVGTPALAADNAKPDTSFHIQKYRFRSHSAENFERFVLEFKRSGNDRKAPKVKVALDAKSGEASIQVDGCQLSGEIPEASMNDAYSTQSKYLGRISVNADNPKMVVFKAALKDPTASLDAFWLEHPSRLVVDVFPKSSPRASGPQVLRGGRAVASVHHHSASGEGKNGFLCFPSSAQVNGVAKEDASIRIDTAAIQSHAQEQGIYCYPKSTQLHAKVVYEPPSVVPKQMTQAAQPAAAFAAPSLLPTAPVAVAPPGSLLSMPMAGPAVPTTRPGVAAAPDLDGLGSMEAAAPSAASSLFPRNPAASAQGGGAGSLLPNNGATATSMGSLLPPTNSKPSGAGGLLPPIR